MEIRRNTGILLEIIVAESLLLFQRSMNRDDSHQMDCADDLETLSAAIRRQAVAEGLTFQAF
jgi:hypothetical protein